MLYDAYLPKLGPERHHEQPFQSQTRWLAAEKTKVAEREQNETKSLTKINDLWQELFLPEQKCEKLRGVIHLPDQRID